MDDREWAARWVRWATTDREWNERQDQFSNAEIAEAVRVKFAEIAEDDPRWVAKQDWRDASSDAALTWMDKGPLAFISAVREAVDGG